MSQPKRRVVTVPARALQAHAAAGNRNSRITHRAAQAGQSRVQALLQNLGKVYSKNYLFVEMLIENVYFREKTSQTVKKRSKTSKNVQKRPKTSNNIQKRPITSKNVQNVKNVLKRPKLYSNMYLTPFFFSHQTTK